MDDNNYRGLEAWQMSRALVVDIYRLTKTFPRDERFGLTHQLQRAAVSIPSNIAESQGRYSRNDTIRMLHIARGSVFEVETQLLIAADLEYTSLVVVDGLSLRIVRIVRKINGLIRYNRKKGDGE